MQSWITFLKNQVNIIHKNKKNITKQQINGKTHKPQKQTNKTNPTQVLPLNVQTKKPRQLGEGDGGGELKESVDPSALI